MGGTILYDICGVTVRFKPTSQDYPYVRLEVDNDACGDYETVEGLDELIESLNKARKALKRALKERDTLRRDAATKKTIVTKRYDLEYTCGDLKELVEAADGDWVRYEDVQTLVENNKNLRYTIQDCLRELEDYDEDNMDKFYNTQTVCAAMQRLEEGIKDKT